MSMNRTFFTTSWDDGHPQDLRVAELLAKYGFCGTFYVPIRNDEGLPVLDAASLRSLATTAEIGSHTLDHRYLNTVPDVEASRQIVDGKRELEQILGQPVAGFCYPGGAYSNRHCRMVATAGFSYARTTSNLYGKTMLDPLRMPTTVQLYPHGRRVFLTNYVRRLDWGTRGGLLWQALSADGLALRLQAMLDAVLRSGGVFHLWGHSYELDEFDGWHLLERFLHYAAKRIPQSDRVSNGALALPGRYSGIVARTTAIKI